MQPSDASTEPTKPSAPASARASLGSNLLIVVLVLALAGGGVWWYRQQHPAAAPEGKGPPGSGGGRPPQPPVPVVTTKVLQKDVPIYLDGLGTVMAYNSVTVRVRVDGQLQKVAFTEGQDVKAGDLLAQIDPDPFLTQVAQAEARKTQDEAQLTNARIQLKRNADLLALKIVSQQDYDTQKALVDQFEATVKADQAAIDSAKVQLNYTKILAPISGRTGLRQVDQGNIVRANDANGLVVIAQLRPISVSFTLPEQTLNDIQQQMARGELPVLAVARDDTSVLDEGKLAVIDNQIDTTTGTIRLKATFPNAD
ncbi:MAG: efflux RND transporter periplasmic adaptor subunit, partial [Verrucomicrobia bacterium]|nr:efflux RND transporter periplasmic adaptor subunit [Verrucomicrobiota bacterium]